MNFFLLEQHKKCEDKKKQSKVLNANSFYHNRSNTPENHFTQCIKTTVFFLLLTTHMIDTLICFSFI